MNEKQDWGGLRSIVEEARGLQDEERRRVDPDCPLCGTPLQVNSRGERDCPMGHYQDQGAPSGGN